MIEIFKDDFLEYSYSAELANISYKVNQAHYGFEVSLGSIRIDMHVEELSTLVEREDNK